MYKMVKTYNICAIMNVSKQLFLQSTACIPRTCWNIDLNFALVGTVSLNIFVPTKFYCAQKSLF